jgi:AcrR family transcriptional regulator
MSQLSENRPVQGLRERKKARTKATIQQEAVRLFIERGYDATTVEQVAAAAEVAPSTVFRYFPTKEDLVLSDDYDPLVFAAFQGQPPELTPIQALLGAFRTSLTGLTSEELTTQRDRTKLILAVPVLRGASFGNLIETMRLVTEVVAERVGRPADNIAVRTFAGAAFGVMMEIMLRWANDPDMDPIAALDEATALLEAGLPF